MPGATTDVRQGDFICDQMKRPMIVPPNQRLQPAAFGAGMRRTPCWGHPKF